MFEIFGIPSTALFGQLLIGLINGSFYALLSLGLAVIFGMLNVINFAHCAQYMMGAFAAFLLLNLTGLGYWTALIVAPILVGIFGIIIERSLLQWLYKLDHLYGLLLTFGLVLIIEGIARNYYGSAGLPYTVPESLQGGRNLGFMFLPNYRAWVIAASLGVCLATWFVIERTKLGSYLRAATENPTEVAAATPLISSEYSEYPYQWLPHGQFENLSSIVTRKYLAVTGAAGTISSRPPSPVSTALIVVQLSSFCGFSWATCTVYFTA